MRFKTLFAAALLAFTPLAFAGHNDSFSVGIGTSTIDSDNSFISEDDSGQLVDVRWDRVLGSSGRWFGNVRIARLDDVAEDSPSGGIGASCLELDLGYKFLDPLKPFQVDFMAGGGFVFSDGVVTQDTATGTVGDGESESTVTVEVMDEDDPVFTRFNAELRLALALNKSRSIKLFLADRYGFPLNPDINSSTAIDSTNELTFGVTFPGF
jgi:hypothetical protein